MAKIVRDSKVSTNPNEYILIKKKRLKLFFEYQGKFKFTPKCSSCSLIVISDHTAHHTHEWSIFSLYAISCAVLMLILILYSVMGVMFTKREMFFFITFPYLPFLFPLHITGKYKPSKKSSTKFYKILQWIFVKLILIRIHKLP